MDLYQILKNYFNVTDLQELCFKLNIDWEDIGPPAAKATKVIQLLRYCQNNNLIPVLITLGKKERPHVNWPDPTESYTLPNFIKLPVTTKQYHEACQTHVTTIVKGVGKKYDPKLYVPRAIEQNLHEFFDTIIEDTDKNSYLIVAPAGSGKTNLLCELARLRVRQQPTFLFLGGSLSLPESTLFSGVIHSSFEKTTPDFSETSVSSVLQTLHQLSEELDQTTLLLIDAINEYPQPQRMLQAIEELVNTVRGQNLRIKILFTCRDYYWNYFESAEFWPEVLVTPLPSRDEEEDVPYDLSLFTPQEHQQALRLYLRQYQVRGELTGNAAEQCRHPLLLRFFCEAYEDQDIEGIEEIRLKHLFDRYWDNKLTSIARRMLKAGVRRPSKLVEQDLGNYLLSLANYMLYHSTRIISHEQLSVATHVDETNGIDHLDSLYSRIRDEFIILEEVEYKNGTLIEWQIAFVYEEFMEYVMAKGLMIDWERRSLTQEKIVDEIENLANRYDEFVQILGVMTYISLMLKESKNIAIWQSLLKRGDKWETAVFSSIRQMSPDQLDNKVYEMLYELLAENSQFIPSTLDILKLQRIGNKAPTNIVERVGKLSVAKDEPIARRATLALGYMPTQLVVPFLLQANQSKYSSVRANAETSIQKLDEQAIDLLALALKDSNASARKAAADALDLFCWQPNDNQIQAWYYMAKQDWGQCVLLKEIAVDPLILALKDNASSVRTAAAGALGQIGGARAVDPLILALKDKDSSVRQAAAAALDLFYWQPNDNQIQAWYYMAKQDWGQCVLLKEIAVDPLILTLKDNASSVRTAAAGALGQIGGARAVDPLILALKDKDSSVRQAAAAALDLFYWQPNDNQIQAWYYMAKQDWGQCVLLKEIAVDPLILTLKDSISSVRTAAAGALGQIGDARAVDPLILTLKDSISSVRTAAASALGQIGDARAVDPLTLALKKRKYKKRYTVRTAAASALGQIGDARAVDPLILALKDNASSVRTAATSALGQIGDARAVDPLILALKDNASSVRTAATSALGQIGDVRAIAPLALALKDRTYSVRVAAIIALGEIADARVVDPLILAFLDRDSSVNISTINAFGQIGATKVVALFILTLRHKNASARKSAADALDQFDWQSNDNQIQAWYYMAKQDWGQCVLLKEITIDPLIFALKGSDSSVRQAAAGALGQIGDARAVDPLILALKDKDSSVRTAAVNALGKIKTQRKPNF